VFFKIGFICRNTHSDHPALWFLITQTELHTFHWYTSRLAAAAVMLLNLSSNLVSHRNPRIARDQRKPRVKPYVLPIPRHDTGLQVILFGVPIDDHFWPSIYPGLFIGAIYGLSARGLANAVAGTLGGMTGAIAVFLILAVSSVDDGIIPLTFLTLNSLATACLFVRALGAVTKSSLQGNKAP
jgi:hypothetical protein